MYEERLREISLFNLEQRMLGTFLSTCIITKVETIEDRPRLFSVMPTDRTRVNEHKLKYRKFCLKIRNKIITFFIVSMVEHKNKLSGQAVESLEILKTKVDMALSNLL